VAHFIKLFTLAVNYLIFLQEYLLKEPKSHKIGKAFDLSMIH